MSEHYSKPTLNFLLFAILYAALLATLELVVGRIELHIAVNQLSGNMLDPVFAIITHLGSGWMFGIASVLLLFVQVRWALIMLIANLISSGVAQGLKRYAFDDMMRPSTLIPDLNLVEGVEIHARNSFPSGHSATIFTIGLVLAFGLRDRKASTFAFASCALIAFSRVYLSQHFIGDVAFGALIGVISALVAKSIIDRAFPEFGFYKLPK